MKKGKLLIISGFSGVGKGTVVKYILDNYSDYKISISATTRSPREGEVDGTHYHFLTTEKFEDMIKNNQLLEYANYVGNYYGTPRDFVEKNKFFILWNILTTVVENDIIFLIIII